MKICKYTQEQEAIKIVARENSGNEGLVYPTADTWNLWIKGGGAQQPNSGLCIWQYQTSGS